MNYELELQADLPDAFNALNGDRAPLVAGPGSATLLSNSVELDFTRFRKGAEQLSFTLEAWFLPVSMANGAVITVLGHPGEGVLWDGTSFIVKISAGGQTTQASWIPTEVRNFHVVLTYSYNRYSLYVDNQLRVTLDVSGEMSSSSTKVGVHYRTGVASAIYDSFASYNRLLSVDTIARHYTLGRSADDARQSALKRGGITYDLTYNRVDVNQRIIYDDTNWDQAYLQNVSFYKGLVTDQDGGSWTCAIPLGTMVDTLPGVYVSVTGVGITIQYSVDGAQSWTNIANKAVILEDATVTDLVLLLRVNLINEKSTVESVRADILNSRVLNPLTGSRKATFKVSLLDETPGSQMEYQLDAGAYLRNGYLQTEVDIADQPLNVKTIEAWLRVDAADGWVLGISGSAYVSVTGGSWTFAGMTAYRNGQPVSNGALPAGEWAHYTFVLNTAVNTTMRFGDKLTGGSALNMSVGHLALYPNTMNAQALYNANVGANVVRIDDTSVITVTEPATPVKSYAYSWSIVA